MDAPWLSLSGRRIVITGAGRDTGRALALILARLGAHVVATARRLDQAQETAQLGQPGLIEAVEIDLGSSSSIEVSCRKIVNGGPVDVLINNGALWLTGHMQEQPIDKVAEAVSATLTGSILMVRQLLDSLRRSPAADVATIVSTAGLSNATMTNAAAAFHAAKAGQSGFVEAARQELRKERIRFTAIYPPDFDQVDPRAPDWSTREGSKVLSRDVVDAVLFAISRPRTVGFMSITLDSFE
jgi:NAD(P)-dependent dehydrogenase (short-subunit alcohol dehydrogenase family)